jgi:hypothetical protein
MLKCLRNGTCPGTEKMTGTWNTLNGVGPDSVVVSQSKYALIGFKAPPKNNLHSITRSSNLE